MSDFTPGEGWREMNADERYEGPRRDQLMWTGTAVGDVRYFVREEPMPPLPTADGTVIDVVWSDHGRERTYNRLTLASNRWWPITNGDWHGPHFLVERIRSFEVVSEPRGVTAKAVIARVRERERAFVQDTRVLGEIADEFGVTE